MLDRIRTFFAPPVFEDDEEKTRVARLLNTVLWIFVGVLSMYAVASIWLPNPGTALPVVGVGIAVGIGAMLLLRRGLVRAAGLLFSVILWVFLTAVALFFGGTETPAVFGYVVVVILAGLFVGGRSAFLFAGLSIVSGLILVWAAGNNVLPPAMGPNPPISTWAALSIYLLVAASLLYLAVGGLDEALERARRTAVELEEQRALLEDAVEERTRDLTRRANYLETTATIARDVAEELDLQVLLSRSVSLIANQFNYYHVGIFLLDGAREWAVLRAASSEGGQRMLARGHRLKVGEIGIVGYVTGRGEPRITPDVATDLTYYDNPDLPDTRSEMALPLQARGEVIGALDVQSIHIEAFNDEDVAVLQVLTDQIAMAISNAQLFQQVQEGMEAERRAYGELSREGWRRLVSQQPDASLLRDKRGISPAGQVRQPEVEIALRTGQTTLDERSATNLVVPIRVRGQMIGAIGAHRPDDRGEWTAEQIELMEMLAEQLGVALENARLYEETQRRAIRDRLIGEIAGRLRASMDPDVILKTTVRELGRALGAEMTAIEVSGPTEGEEGPFWEGRAPFAGGEGDGGDATL